MNTLTVAEPEKRLHDDLLKFGIRTVIDGRAQGVRESLEEKTARLISEAAEFLSTNQIISM